MEQKNENLLFNYKKSVMQTPKGLILFFHGLGSNKDDLIGLAPYFKDYDLYSFSAPVRVSRRLNIKCCSWYTWERDFDLSQDNLHELECLQNQILSIIKDNPLYQNGAPICTFGFSQGGVMAIHIARCIPVHKAMILGSFYPLEYLTESAILISEIFIGHGERDLIVPFYYAQKLHTHLKQLSTIKKIVYSLYPDLGHTISEKQMEDIIYFLKN